MALAYEAETMRDGRRLGAAADVELGEDARDVHARGLLSHEQLRADLAVRRAAGQQLEHLALARREAERVLVGGGERQPGAAGQALGLAAQPRRAERVGGGEHVGELRRGGVALAAFD